MRILALSKDRRAFKIIFWVVILSTLSAIRYPLNTLSQDLPSPEFVHQSWDASSKGNEAGLMKLVEMCVRLYGNEATLMSTQLSGFPDRGEEARYQILNDVATCLFIRAEYLMNHGKTNEAIAEFQKIITQYPYAQSWDPRGWFWSVAEKSQDSIDVLTGKAEENMMKSENIKDLTIPKLFKPGKEKIIDYSKYGKFLNVGTSKYHYSITDIQGLKEAVGEGIYPNNSDVLDDPNYQKAKKEGRLEGTHWSYVNSNDQEAAFYKWATVKEEQSGVKLFYTGMIFERAKMYYEALKAYNALIVHFPKTVAWTYWQTPWYPGQAAISKIRYILRMHPELKLQTKDMKIEVENGFDNNAGNDVFITYPGKIISRNIVDLMKDQLRIKDKLALIKIKKKVGEGKVRLEQYVNGHWRLFVDNKPYVIKGVTYAPTKVGESPDKGTLTNWMESDINHNGRIDGPYDAWVDKNKNNFQDPDEPVIGDFELMKEMGVNTLRVYYNPMKPNKELLRKLFNEHGIRVIMVNFLGKYAIGSGASWVEGTDYEKPEHKKNMLESVKQMVMEFKDEPYILLWVLGNENNYGVACNADKKPEAYYSFINEVAQWIHSVDKDHLVAASNGDTLFLDIFARQATAVDIFAANVYRGDYGFGSFWEQVEAVAQKPAFITEYGAPAYSQNLTSEEADEAQAEYHRGNWLDIESNLAGETDGMGNALGGIAFEWLDEWWKNYEAFRHDRKSDAIGPFPGGYYYEEWFGLNSQGNGKYSPFLRQPRQSYFAYKEMWNK